MEYTISNKRGDKELLVYADQEAFLISIREGNEDQCIVLRKKDISDLRACLKQVEKNMKEVKNG